MGVNASTSTVVPATFEVPDTELLRAWVRHRRQADFTEIVRRHLGLVRGIARRQVGMNLADDTAQMVFAILARKASGLTELRSLGSWLHRVTTLQCKGVIRGQIRDRRSHQSAMEIARLANARDPLAEVLPYLDSAICDLPESDRELIHLRYCENLTFPEVARRTGRSEAALRQQAGRTLVKLSGLLQRRGVGVSAATLAAGLGTTLTGTSSASAAASISSAAITYAAMNGGSWITWITLLTMTTKKILLLVGLIAALATMLGVWKTREAKDSATSDAGSSTKSPQSASTSAEIDSEPAKTKADRSRAIAQPSPEDVEEKLKQKERQTRAVNNARQVGIALFEFESEFGSYPNEKTAAALKLASGNSAPLGAATANDCFYQLIAANIVMNPVIFTWDELQQEKATVGLENCGFSFLYGMPNEVPAFCPILVAPLIPGTGLFDRKPFGGKAVVLRADNSITSLAIEQDGTVMVDGMDLFDPAQPFWQGKAPTIRWPKK